jgi:hypothetical protein
LASALVNLFPVECRCDLSFATGLKHSPRRPFRLVLLPKDSRGTRTAARHTGLSVIDLDEPESFLGPWDRGWPRLVAEMMAAGRLAQFSRILAVARPGLQGGDLDGLGDELAEHFRAALA